MLLMLLIQSDFLSFSFVIRIMSASMHLICSTVDLNLNLILFEVTLKVFCVKAAGFLDIYKKHNSLNTVKSV